MNLVLLFLTVYFLGSIPVGLIVAKLVKGVDIREFGSGNIGATNVTRVVGKKWGVLVFMLDFMKGFLAPLLVGLFCSGSSILVYIFSAVVAVCGHNWPIFLKFKGGKGVSTSLGAIVGLTIKFPSLFAVIIISVIIWNLIYFWTKTVSVASILAALSLPIFSFVFNVSWEFKLLTISLFVLVIVRHKTNITNIINKQEHKF